MEPMHPDEKAKIMRCATHGCTNLVTQAGIRYCNNCNEWPEIRTGFENMPEPMLDALIAEHEGKPRVKTYYCRTPHCNNLVTQKETRCTACVTKAQATSGGDNDYWVLEIDSPKRLDPYFAECDDLISKLGLTFAEGNVFKAIWRRGAIRLGAGKPDDTPLRNAQKAVYYSKLMEAHELKLEQQRSED